MFRNYKLLSVVIAIAFMIPGICLSHKQSGNHYHLHDHPRTEEYYEGMGEEVHQYLDHGDGTAHTHDHIYHRHAGHGSNWQGIIFFPTQNKPLPDHGPWHTHEYTHTHAAQKRSTTDQQKVEVPENTYLVLPPDDLTQQTDAVPQAQQGVKPPANTYLVLPPDDLTKQINPNSVSNGIDGQPPVPREVPSTQQQPNTLQQPSVTIQLEGSVAQAPAPPTTSGPPATVTPEAQPQTSVVLEDVRITEHMLRDHGGLPQWIELYNPNLVAINLKGWTFQYATRKFANYPYEIHTVTLADTEDGFEIPAGAVAILTTHRVYHGWEFSGIEPALVYNLDIPNVLKNGWTLADNQGNDIYRIGVAFRTDELPTLGNPQLPTHQGKSRVSHNVYATQTPDEPYFYGLSSDIGTPGYYKEPVPSAPSLLKPTLIGTWGALKRE